MCYVNTPLACPLWHLSTRHQHNLFDGRYTLKAPSCRIHATCVSLLRVLWHPSSLVAPLLLPISACGPDHAPFQARAPLRQLVPLLVSFALVAILHSSFPRAPCACDNLLGHNCLAVALRLPCHAQSPTGSFPGLDHCILDVVLRRNLATTRQNLSVSSVVEFVPTSPPATFPLKLPPVMPCSSAARAFFLLLLFPLGFHCYFLTLPLWFF